MRLLKMWYQNRLTELEIRDKLLLFFFRIRMDDLAYHMIKEVKLNAV